MYYIRGRLITGQSVTTGFEPGYRDNRRQTEFWKVCRAPKSLFKFVYLIKYPYIASYQRSSTGPSWSGVGVVGSTENGRVGRSFRVVTGRKLTRRTCRRHINLYTRKELYNPYTYMLSHIYERMPCFHMYIYIYIYFISCQKIYNSLQTDQREVNIFWKKTYIAS